MAIQWPGTLPEIPLKSGLNETPQDQVLRSSPDAGPGKSRRRFTAGAKNHTVMMRMSTAQVGIFEAFFDDDLHGGSLRFELAHYRTGVTKEFKFSKPYTIAPRGGSFWNVTLPLKEMP